MTTQLPAYVAILLFYVSRTSCQDTFTAAVYEHAVILPNVTLTPVSREEALALMNRNLDILEGAITSAAQQGAHIIVTPEDGIYGWNFTRDSLYPYLEDIPDPEVNWIPCNNPNRFGQTPVQERLSCLAKKNSIYVVANIGDKKPCNTSDPRCPPDGRYQYNTDVVFDSQGKLVARYHKICTLLKCKTTNLNTCGDSVETASTRFEMFSLSGTFGTQYVFPEVLLSENQLAPGEFQVSTDGRLFSLKPTSGPVLTVTLFGRLYEKDWASAASSGLTAQARRIMLIVIAPIVYSLI
ncbi:pantetheinase isoform X2 [Theropithecus gelada]|uniref:pantetheinase isoform X2 n=1 Tax=Theropithecus gelada TaxID=9565 RepID=UPI000DC17A91|nr:pantetheinase isoform X2 [Theropithecus gelada]